MTLREKAVEAFARHFDAAAMEIDAALDLDVASQKLLGRAPVETGDRRRLVRKVTRHMHVGR